MKVLVFLAALVAGHAINAESLLAKPYSSAQVNEFADRLLTLLRPFIVQHNLDPANVVDLDLDFTLNFLGSHDGNLKLRNGILTGLSTIQRDDRDCTLDYNFRLLNIGINAGAPELSGVFDYDMSVMGLNPSGVLTAKISDLEINISVLLDMKETTMTLQHLEVTNIGKVDIHLSGGGWLSDAFYNLVVDVVIGLFKDKVVHSIIDQVAQYVDEYMRSLPPILPQLPPPQIVKF